MPEHFYAQQYNQFAEVERMRQVEQIRAARMLMEQRDLAQQRIQVETQAALARHEMAMRQKQQYLHRLQRLQAQNLEWRQQGEHWRREHSRTTSEGSSGRSSSPWGDVLPTISYEGAHGLATPSQRTDYAHSVSTVQNSEMDLADESGSAIDGDQIVSGPRNDLAIQSQMDVTASNIVVCEIDTMADDTDYEDALSYAEWIAGDDDNTDVFEDTVADDSLSQSQAQVAASSKKSKKKQQRHQKQQRQRETQTQNVRQPCTPSSTTASSISSWSETITAWWRHWTRRPKRKVDVGKMYRRRLAEANRDVPAKKDKGGHFPSTPDEQKIADGYIQHMRNNEKLLLEFAPRAITEFVESLKIMRWSLEHHQMLIIRRLRKATIGLKNILRSFDPEWNAAQRLILPRRYATDLVDPKRRRRVEPYAMDHMPNLAAMESLNNVMWLYESYAEAIFKQYAACSWFVPLTSYSNAFFDPRTNPGWGAIIDRTVPQSTDAMALAYLKQLGLYDPPIENVKMKIKQSKGKK